jgi:hypothetical protein
MPMMGTLRLVVDVNISGKFQGADTGNKESGLRIAIATGSNPSAVCSPIGGCIFNAEPLGKRARAAVAVGDEIDSG